MIGWAMRRHERRQWMPCGDCGEFWKGSDTECRSITLPGAVNSYARWRRRGSVWELTERCVCDKQTIGIGSRRPAPWLKKCFKAQHSPSPETRCCLPSDGENHGTHETNNL